MVSGVSTGTEPTASPVAGLRTSIVSAAAPFVPFAPGLIALLVSTVPLSTGCSLR
jgi:hypothetical protein